MDPIALPALISIVFAYLVEGERREDPPWAGEGPSDADIWDLIQTDGNVLGDMTFDQAVVHDPRRIDALIQKRIIGQFYSALEVLRGGDPDLATRHTYLLQMHALREIEGDVTAQGLKNIYEQMWGYYSQVLEQGMRMARENSPAERVWRAIVANRDEIQRAFREAGGTAGRASGAATDEQSCLAWRSIEEIIGNMASTLDSQLVAAGMLTAEQIGLPELAPPPRLEGEEEEGYGAWRPEWAGYMASGHRAPEAGLGKYRQAGGRFY